VNAFALGAVLALVIASAAWRTRALTRDGAIAAFFVGASVFGSLGTAGALLLLAFFIPSIGLSRLGRARKRALVDIGKHGARDAMQVLANGGVAALCALLALHGDQRWSTAFAGAFAAATADTWGTEIGTLVAATPRSIISGKPVARGLSGGVTLAGTAAEIAGALFIALVAGAVGIPRIAAVAVAGIGGALIDSLLGGTLQSLRWCARCKRPCETQPHMCGENTQPIRGLSWFGNDLVNLGATLSGAAVAFFL
jgi:uncharacterized protein (TIGR00297 family)